MAIIPSNEKVFMVSNSTNTVYGGSAAMQAMTKWYTMEDVIDTVRPYQVFTALVSQTGTDDVGVLISGDLTIGVTYTILVTDALVDFTNVGAPNNVEGTQFIATGNTPNSWGAGGELEYNAAAPTVTVLENTIGNIWFGYNAIGQYGIYSSGLFIENKTWVNPVILLGVNGPTSRGVTYFNTYDLIGIFTESDIDSPSNDLLVNTPIEIRVYN